MSLVLVLSVLALVGCTRERPLEGAPISPRTTTPTDPGKADAASAAVPPGLPSLISGERCPRTPGVPGHRYSRTFGLSFALGDGPVYPMFVGLDPRHVHHARGSTVHFTNDRMKGGWLRVKVLWIPRQAPTARSSSAAASSTEPCPSGSGVARHHGTGCCLARPAPPLPGG